MIPRFALVARVCARCERVDGGSANERNFLLVEVHVLNDPVQVHASELERTLVHWLLLHPCELGLVCDILLRKHLLNKSHWERCDLFAADQEHTITWCLLLESSLDVKVDFP